MNSESKRRRVVVLVLVVIAAGALGYLALSSIGENLVYYWSPSEVEQAGEQAVGATIRLGGLVEPGSIDRAGDGLTLRFAVTDGKISVPVYATAVPPAMFREGIGVVVEGTMTAAGTFETQRLMVKHDNQYEAPGGMEEVDVKELMKSMQFDGEEGGG